MLDFRSHYGGGPGGTESALLELAISCPSNSRDVKGPKDSYMVHLIEF